MWELEYSPEATNYVLDSYPYNEAVLVAIETLAQTDEGIPDANWDEWQPEYFLWVVAEHLVSYQKILDERPKLRILIIKPLD